MENKAAPKLFQTAFFLGLSHLAHVAVGVTDVAMAGWLGSEILAAAALAASLFYVVILTSVGFISGLSPLIAKYEGAGETDNILKTINLSGWVVAVFSIIGMLVLGFGQELLLLFQQPDELITLTGPYLYYLIPSVIAVALYCYLWIFASIRGQSQAIFWISLISIVVNAVGNYVFMFGIGEFQGMSLAGLGLSTFLSICFKMLALYLWLKYKKVLGRFIFVNPVNLFSRKDLFLILSYGAPMAVLEAATIGFFSALLFIIGLAGADYIAVHAITLQLAEIGIVFSLGVSEAAAISIAYYIGKKETVILGKTIRNALYFGISSMIIYAAILYIFGGYLIPLFLEAETQSEFILDTARSILYLASICLIVDAARITLIGVLRGLGDAERPVYYSMFGFWGISLPCAYLLAIYFQMNNTGIWLSLIIGVALTSITLIHRLKTLKQSQKNHITSDI